MSETVAFKLAVGNPVRFPADIDAVCSLGNHTFEVLLMVVGLDGSAGNLAAIDEWHIE
jgi:hypothetical protein